MKAKKSWINERENNDDKWICVNENTKLLDRSCGNHCLLINGNGDDGGGDGPFTRITTPTAKTTTPTLTIDYGIQ